MAHIVPNVSPISGAVSGNDRSNSDSNMCNSVCVRNSRISSQNCVSNSSVSVSESVCDNVKEMEAMAAFCIEFDDIIAIEECQVSEVHIAMSSALNNLIEKFDTACSRSISGNPGRIKAVDVGHNILISGFNNSTSEVTAVGINNDSKTEYYVTGMPDNLALLCANDYVEGGAAILFHNDGVVIELSPSEMVELREFIEEYTVVKRLVVNNRTYEVARDVENDIAYASSSFFNTKVNTNSSDELVTSTLMMGIPLPALQNAIRNGTITGFHPKLTTQRLSNFEAKWGRSPDVVQMAYPNKKGNEKGYMTKPHVYTYVGERVEMDFMECDFNEESVADPIPTSNSVFRKKVRKLVSAGGAVAAWVAYDVYSGFVYGRLVTSMANAHECVKELVEYYEKHGHKIVELAADRGILTEGKFRINTPATIAYCSSKGIRTKGAEPYNHSNGTPHAERVIQVVSNMIRQATHYLLMNPNVKFLGYTRQDILKLWGELFNWTQAVIPMRDSPKNIKVSRYELFYGRVPNVQETRLLPIFSVLLVYRHVPTVSSLDGANRAFYQHGLYVGPDWMVHGAIRVAVKVNGIFQIIVSSKYKCVTDGGSVNISQSVQRGLRTMLEGTEQQAVDEVVDCTPTTTPIPLARIPVPVHSPPVVIAEDVATSIDVESTPVVSSNTPELRGDDTSKESNSVLKSRERNAKRFSKLKEKVKVRKELDRSSWASREERAKRRMELVSEVAHYSIPVPKCVPSCIDTGPQLIDACYADWSTHEKHYKYYSVVENVFYSVAVVQVKQGDVVISEGYRAVTVGVPKSYPDALVDAKWGEAARTEWNTLVETKALLLVDTEFAKESIRKGADLVVLFPVYEEKEKEGKLVRKVRLVGDGRTHYSAGSTYSPTPSREELLVILHTAAKYDWDIVHIDEVRAFLNATYKGDEPVYTKLRGDNKYYEVVKALYGLKSSPRDYNAEVRAKLISLGFTPLLLSNQLYIFKDETDALVLIYDFVDDFVITGNNLESIKRFIERFRVVTNTTEPAYNPTKLLGMELERDREKRVIKVTMKSKIRELGEKYSLEKEKVRRVPIPMSQYLVKEYDYEDSSKVTEDNARMLDRSGITKYMQIVGSLIWLTGVRIDIVFATTYLAWHTCAPRQHHLNMSVYVLSYLYNSVDVPLVLGGKGKLGVLTESDASLGTAPKGRSVLGQITRLGVGAGAVTAKATASTLTHCSSFEAELDACSRAMKSIQYISNILYELGIEQEQPVLYCDNEAMVNFVKGDSVAKGVRHMELRLWYTREQYKLGHCNLMWRSGKVIAADKLTKLADQEAQVAFRYNVQGLGLLDD